MDHLIDDETEINKNTQDQWIDYCYEHIQNVLKELQEVIVDIIE